MKRLCKVAGMFGLALLTSVAHSDDRLGATIAAGVLNAAFGTLKTAAPALEQTAPGAPNTAKSGASGWRGDVPPLYATKEAFLAAAKRGELAGMADVRDSDDSDAVKAVLASVAVILADEYQTPIPDDTRTGTCRSTIKTNLLSALRNTTAGPLQTLSTRPPDFRANVQAPNLDWILLGIRSHCATRVAGSVRPYPVVGSLIELLKEYGSATGEFVEATRAERISQYQAAELARQEAIERENARRRGAEQQRINAERRRIEDNQRQQQQRNAARISG